MKLHSLVPCAAVLCALTTSGFSQSIAAKPISRPQVLGAADPNATAHFSVYLPLTNKAALEQLLIDQTNAASPSYHQWLTPAQFKAQFGPDPKDLKKVEKKLEAAGFTITAHHTQSIEVEGSVASVESLLSTRIQQVKTEKGVELSAAKHAMKLPAELASVGAVIPEFSPQLAAHIHSHRLEVSANKSPLLAGGALPNQRLGSADAFFYPNDMKEAYSFASFTTSVSPKTGGPAKQIVGLGTTIGILISSTISPTDLARAFTSSVSAGAATDVQNFLGAQTTSTKIPVPTVTVVPVLGGSGAFNPNSDDAGEASLDTQMSLGTAPGAAERLYDIPSLTDSNIIAGYTQIDEDNLVDVVSSSFGECELDFTAAANGGVDFTGTLQVFHSLFAQGNSQGITFVASSGDNGAVPCTSAAFDNNPTNGTNFVLGVENPASDPAVTAVGGTNLSVTATPTVNDSTYSAENANYDPRTPAQFQLSSTTTVTVGNNTWGSGGGYSVVFAQPAYQTLVNTGSTTARAVPDVSLMMGGCPGDADLTAQDCETLPRSAAVVWIANAPNLLIGTSSSAPQMAGVIALSVELAGSRLGNINPQLYALAQLQSKASGKTANLAQVYHRTVSGNNNGYLATPGQAYNPVLGLGTLFVKNFLQLQSAAAAGTPNTGTNP